MIGTKSISIATILILLAVSTGHTKVSPLKLTNDTITLETLKGIEPSPLQLKLGLKIKRAIRRLRWGRATHREFQILKTELHKEKIIFSDYITWATRVQKVLASSNSRQLYTTCNREIHTRPIAPIARHLQLLLVRACSKKFIDALLKQKTVKKSELKLISTNIRYFLTPHLAAKTLSLHKRISSQPKNFKFLSESILKHYRAHNKLPPEAFIQNISLRRELYKKVTENYPKLLKISYPIAKQVNTTARHIIKSLEKNQLSETAIKNLVSELTNLINRYQGYLKEEETYTLLNSIGRRLISRHYFDSAQKLLSKALEFSPSDNYSEAAFLALWPFIAQNQYKKASSFISKQTLHAKFDNLDSRLQFWIGHSMQQIGETRLAKFYFKQIIQNSYLDYYSILSSIEISKLIPSKELENPIKDKIFAPKNMQLFSEKITSKDLSPLLRQSIKRLTIWSKIKSSYLTQLEVSQLLQAKLNQIVKIKLKDLTTLDLKNLKSRLILLTAQILSRYENYLGTFRVIYRGLNAGIIELDRTTYRLLFPSPYAGEISKLSKELDPLVVLSLIRQESGFNQVARSRVGAVGLMQLMPATAKRIDKKITREELHNPDKNLKIGISHLEMLHRKYDGNLFFALSAYNAGESRTNYWIKNVFGDLPMIKASEMIPYEETRKYVKLIFRNLFFYKTIQQKPALTQKIAQYLYNAPSSTR